MRAASILISVLAAGCGTESQYPDPLSAGWEGRDVCELLHEDASQRILRCTFPPSTGHERHYHNAHFGYVLAGSRIRITDANGVREADYETGTGAYNEAIEWHEAVNVGDTTAMFLIVEEK